MTSVILKRQFNYSKNWVKQEITDECGERRYENNVDAISFKSTTERPRSRQGESSTGALGSQRELNY